MPAAIQALDEQVLLWIQECIRQGVLDPLVKLYTTLGNAGIVWIVVSVAMLCWKPTRRAGVTALCAMVLGLLCTNVVLKHLVSRAPALHRGGGTHPPAHLGDPTPSPRPYLRRLCSGVAWFGTAKKEAGGPPPSFRRSLWACPGCMWESTTPSDVLAGAIIGTLCGLGGLCW